MNLIEKIILVKIRRYGILTVSIITILSAVGIAILESKIDFQITKTLLVYTIFIATIFILFVYILLEIWGNILYPKILIPLRVLIKTLFKKNVINDIPAISNWTFQGSLKIENSLEITSSNSGALINNRLFKNFTMSFNLKIKNYGALGIIFRAQNLENYLMLQIRHFYLHQNNQIVIVPHIKFEGNFETFSIDHNNPYFDTEIKHNANNELSIFLKVNGDEVLLKINSVNFEWQIPTHTELNIIQIPEGNEKTLENKLTSKIWFRNNYGKIGFRAYGHEKGIISKLKVS